VSLFFAYTKPKPSGMDAIYTAFGLQPSEVVTICDKCGAELRAGDWPFCSGHQGQKTENDDE
jgi:hypothetical protein